MTRIGGILGGPTPARRIQRGTGRFVLSEREPAGEAATASAAAAVPALLALQEAPGPRATPAERARQQAEAALDTLRGLQLELLGGRADPARLEELARLPAVGEGVADPGLRAAVTEIALRARVELARRRVATASAS